MASSGTLSGLGAALEAIGQGVSRAPGVYYAAKDKDAERKRRDLNYQREDAKMKLEDDAKARAKAVVDEARLLYGDDVANGVSETLASGADPDEIQRKVRSGESNGARTERIRMSRAAPESALSLAGGRPQPTQEQSPTSNVMDTVSQVGRAKADNQNQAFGVLDDLNKKRQSLQSGGLSFGTDLYKGLREATGMQESSGNYASIGVQTKVGKGLGKYQHMPSVWFKLIGLDPNSEKDKQRFLNSPDLQEKMKDAQDNELLQRAGGDPRKYIALHYASPKLVNDIWSGVKTGDEPVQDGPTVNQYINEVFDKYEKATGTPVDNFSSQSDSDHVSRFSRDALLNIVQNKPQSPKEGRNPYEDRAKYILSKLSSSEEIDAARPMLESLAKLSNNISEKNKESNSKFKDELNNWHTNVRFGAGLESKADIESNKQSIKYKLSTGQNLSKTERENFARLRLRRQIIIDKKKDVQRITDRWAAAEKPAERKAATEALAEYIKTDEGPFGLGKYLSFLSSKDLDSGKISEINRALDSQLEDVNLELGGDLFDKKDESADTGTTPTTSNNLSKYMTLIGKK